MIAVFLRAEIDSDRFGEKLRRILERDGRPEQVLRRPDLESRSENRYRRDVLEEHRAYERRAGLFGDFPDRVEWYRAMASADEVLDILYIAWDWWLRLSGGSRKPRDAARRVRAGEVAGVAVGKGDRMIAAALGGEHPPPELIALGTPELAPLVLVEGHVRLTAYALFPECLPPELELLVGVSEDATRWCQF